MTLSENWLESMATCNILRWSRKERTSPDLVLSLFQKNFGRQIELPRVRNSRIARVQVTLQKPKPIEKMSLAAKNDRKRKGCQRVGVEPMSEKESFVMIMDPRYQKIF